jgi:16S rRNA processing protein RimM
MPKKSQEKIIIGRIGAPFGILGWLKINSFSEPKDKILEYQPWYLEENSGWQELTIEAGKWHSNQIIAKLPGCDDRTTAQSYTNKNILIDASLLPPTKKNEYYWRDLEGLEVINKDNENLGVVDRVLATGANDVLAVKGDRMRLIPYIKDVILKVDLPKKRITVDWDKDF